MIQPLHIHEGVPAELRGQYSVPHDEVWVRGWGTLDGAHELEILRQWVSSGFKHEANT